MADAGANAGCHQAVMVMIGANFGQASELGEAEMGTGADIEKDAGGKEQPAGNPGPGHRIQRQVAPWTGQGADADPHGDPSWNQDTKWGTHAGTPAVRTRMDHQPERRDSGIQNTSQP